RRQSDRGGGQGEHVQKAGGLPSGARPQTGGPTSGRTARERHSARAVGAFTGRKPSWPMKASISGCLPNGVRPSSGAAIVVILGTVLRPRTGAIRCNCQNWQATG